MFVYLYVSLALMEMNRNGRLSKRRFRRICLKLPTLPTVRTPSAMAASSLPIAATAGRSSLMLGRMPAKTSFGRSLSLTTASGCGFSVQAALSDVYCRLNGLTNKRPISFHEVG